MLGVISENSIGFIGVHCYLLESCYDFVYLPVPCYNLSNEKEEKGTDSERTQVEENWVILKCGYEFSQYGNEGVEDILDHIKDL